MKTIYEIIKEYNEQADEQEEMKWREEYVAMKVSEILSKIIGLDPNKEYNLDLAEINETVQQPQTPPETQPKETPAVDNNSTVELDSLRNQIAELSKQCENLKELNRALVLNTAAEPEKTVEQRIMELCYPQSKGEET